MRNSVAVSSLPFHDDLQTFSPLPCLPGHLASMVSLYKMSPSDSAFWGWNQRIPFAFFSFFEAKVMGPTQGPRNMQHLAISADFVVFEASQGSHNMT
jgi:hypothetical protein